MKPRVNFGNTGNSYAIKYPISYLVPQPPLTPPQLLFLRPIPLLSPRPILQQLQTITLSTMQQPTLPEEVPPIMWHITLLLLN